MMKKIFADAIFTMSFRGASNREPGISRFPDVQLHIWGLSRFPDVQLHIWGLVLRTIPE